MADKCTGFLKKQPEPKMNDGEHKSSVTSDSAASTEVKTAINVDNAKSMLSIVGAAEIVSSKVTLASRATAYTPPNETTATKATSVNLANTPNNIISSKTVRNTASCLPIYFIYHHLHLHLHFHRYHYYKYICCCPKSTNKSKQNKINLKTVEFN